MLEKFTQLGLFLSSKSHNDALYLNTTHTTVQHQIHEKHVHYFQKIHVISNGDPFVFAVISSKMHSVWSNAISGRLKSDLNYSVSLTYNSFLFPDISTKQKENLNLYVFAILDERAKHNKTMAQLYRPLTMPKGLLQAHQELDTAIEQCYRLQPFKNDIERLEYLFKQYEIMVNDELLMVNDKGSLFAKQKKRRKEL